MSKCTSSTDILLLSLMNFFETEKCLRNKAQGSSSKKGDEKMCSLFKIVHD